MKVTVLNDKTLQSFTEDVIVKHVKENTIDKNLTIYTIVLGDKFKKVLTENVCNSQHDICLFSVNKFIIPDMFWIK